MVFIVLAIGLLFSLAGLAVDMIFTYAVKVRLVTAVDSTALGIARALGRGVTQSDQATEITRTSDMLFDANFPQQFMLTGSSPRISQGPTISGPNVTPMGTVFENDPSIQSGMRQVRLTGEVSVPMFFFRIFGVDSLPVRASARAARQDVNIMLVLDRSASMLNAGAWPPLQNAAVFFLNQFDNTTDNLGIVTYGSSARVDLPIGTGFKTGNVGQNTIMNQVVPPSAGTNAPMGLWLGLAELLSLNNPNALNVIAFFTDGNPTGYTARFNVFTTNNAANRAHCPGNAQLTAALLTGGNTEADVVDMYGMFEQYAPYPAVYAGETVDYYLRHQPGVYTNRLCNNLTPMLGDQTETAFNGCLPLNWIPDYKNPAGAGQRTYSTKFTTDGPSFAINECNAALFSDAGANNSTRGRHVHRTAKTLALNVASDARNEANAVGGVILYSIGLGAVDPTFLERISNDVDSADYVAAGQTEGLYVFAPTPAQLQQAFQQVANEIFRLIQ
jgi:hypothetical protein